MKAAALAAVACLAIALPAVAEPAPPDLVAELRVKDQALMDSYVPGDKSIWEKVLAPELVLVDENGAIFTRQSFLDSLKPLGAGSTGKINIIDYQVTLSGDAALVVHKDDEYENWHGHALRAQYLTSETWLKRSDGWKLAAVHAYVLPHDPPAMTVPAATLDGYVGRYTAGAGLVFVIARQGDGLIGGREGQKPDPILIESGDVSFTPGDYRWRRVFERDAAGKVTGFIERREGEDIEWKRTS
ncbi:MAG TPA: DUF4440 domain-containing protein [Caulobacteraceae bacterium]